MPRLYFIGDTHFGHTKLALLRGFSTVGAHDSELAYRWNHVVRLKDIVYHLGDVAFHNFEILGTLNGYKKLVLGNHDNWNKLSPYFDRCYGAVAFQTMVITHIPVNAGQFTRFSHNLHGHTHNTNLPDPHYVNLSAEQTFLSPVTLEEVTKRFITPHPQPNA